MNITLKPPLHFLFDDYGQPIQGKPVFIESKGANMVSEAFWQTPCAFYLGVEPYAPDDLLHGKSETDHWVKTHYHNPKSPFKYKVNAFRLYCLCPFNDANQKRLYGSFNHLMDDLLANLFNFGLCNIHATPEIAFKDEIQIIRHLKGALIDWLRDSRFNPNHYGFNEGLVLGKDLIGVNPPFGFSLVYVVYDAQTQQLKPALIYKPTFLVSQNKSRFNDLSESKIIMAPEEITRKGIVNITNWKAQCANPNLSNHQKIHQLSPILPRLIYLTEMLGFDLNQIEDWLATKLEPKIYSGSK